jgi:chromosome segregation ATPase
MLLEKLGTVAHDLETKIGSMGNQVAGSLSQVNEKAFADIAKQMTESLHKATEVHLKSIAERLEAVSATLAKLPREFEALVGLVQENTTSIATAFATAVVPIETSLAAASNSAQDVASKFATLPDALEPARAAAKDLTSAASTISEMVGRIYSQNETVVKRWQELSGMILTIDTHLAGAVESVGSVFPAYAEKLQDFSHKWESAMVAALGGLSANIRDLSRSHEELRTQRTVWHDSADAVARSVDAVNDHVTRFTEALATHGEAQKLALQSAVVTNGPLPQDSQNSSAGAEESSNAETISTTTPA